MAEEIRLRFRLRKKEHYTIERDRLKLQGSWDGDWWSPGIGIVQPRAFIERSGYRILEQVGGDSVEMQTEHTETSPPPIYSTLPYKITIVWAKSVIGRFDARKTEMTVLKTSEQNGMLSLKTPNGTRRIPLANILFYDIPFDVENQ